MALGRNYVRKGDPFTRMVQRGEGPPTVIHWVNQNTGRDYFTRVPVHRCHVLRARDVANAIREQAQELAQRLGKPAQVSLLAQALALDWEPRAGRVTLRVVSQALTPGAVRLALDVTGTGVGGKGARVWLTCPRCSRRCGAVYGSGWNARGKTPGEPVTGCRVCLGLTDESRQTHKTLSWVGAVDGSRPFAPDRYGRYRVRSEVTRWRAQGVMMASLRRVFGKEFLDRMGRDSV